MGRAELFELAKALPLAERVQWAGQIWDSITAEGHDPDLTTEQLEELERRAEEFRKNPNTGTPWEEVRADVRKRHGWRGDGNLCPTVFTSPKLTKLSV